MFRAVPALFLAVATAAGFASAQSYQDFTLDTTVVPQFVSRLDPFSQASPSTAKAACNAIDDCLGFICSEGCYLFRYSPDGDLSPGSTGWDSISFR